MHGFGLGLACGMWRDRFKGGQEVQQVRRDSDGRGGPRPDSEPQGLGGVQVRAGGEVNSLRRRGQSSFDDHDRPRVARRRSRSRGWCPPGDQRETASGISGQSLRWKPVIVCSRMIGGGWEGASVGRAVRRLPAAVSLPTWSTGSRQRDEALEPGRKPPTSPVGA